MVNSGSYWSIMHDRDHVSRTPLRDAGSKQEFLVIPTSTLRSSGSHQQH